MKNLQIVHELLRLDETSDQSAEKSAQSIALFEADHEEALAWARTQPFSSDPNYDICTEQGRHALAFSIPACERSGVWSEVWAASHLLLSAGTVEYSMDDLIQRCLDLTWAHLHDGTRSRSADAPFLYLDLASFLLDSTGQSRDSEAAVSVRAARLHACVRHPGRPHEFTDLVSESLSDEEFATKVAQLLFNKAIPASRLTKDDGSQQYLNAANEMLQCSVVLNERLDNRQALGVIAYELGHLAQKQGRKADAKDKFKEALTILEPTGMDCTTIKKSLRSLSFFGGLFKSE